MQAFFTQHETNNTQKFETPYVEHFLRLSSFSSVPLSESRDMELQLRSYRFLPHPLQFTSRSILCHAAWITDKSLHKTQTNRLRNSCVDF